MIFFKKNYSDSRFGANYPISRPVKESIAPFIANLNGLESGLLNGSSLCGVLLKVKTGISDRFYGFYFFRAEVSIETALQFSNEQ